MFKTIGQVEAESKERINRLRAKPESATSEDVTWLILQLEIESNKIPNDGYYC